MDDFFERYTFECRPDFCVKVRKPVRNFIIGGGYEFTPQQLHLTIKPRDKEAKWRKVLYSPMEKDVRIFTNKLAVGYLRFQLVAGYDFGIRRAGVHWRVTTAWGGGAASMGRKEKLDVNKFIQVRPTWTADYRLPDAEGELGTGDEHFEFDYGQFHFEVPRVEGVLRLP